MFRFIAGVFTCALLVLVGGERLARWIVTADAVIRTEVTRLEAGTAELRERQAAEIRRQP